MAFNNPAGFFALLALIPFILLYLRRPKPRDRVIPSLMFLVKDKKQSKQYQFLQRFLTNLLFFIQLLLFILLAVALATPTLDLNYDVTLENTIIILDGSASMQSDEGGTTRFEDAQREAKKVVSGRNSLILAENIPLIILEEETAEVTSSFIDSLSAKATSTNLGDAMLLAKDLLGEKPGRIVVISDFSNVDGPDLLVVKRTLSSEDVVINFKDVSNHAENAGIIGMDVRKNSVKLFVKNYNSVQKDVTLTLIKDGDEIARSNTITVLPNSIETVFFDDTPTGTSSIELLPTDDLMVDNTAYLSAPLKKRTNVLLITNRDQSNLERALRASPDISLNVVNPPVLTLNTQGSRIEPFEHDVIVVHEINNVGSREGILPGTYQDIERFVDAGGHVVISAQTNLADFDMGPLDIMRPQSLLQSPTQACVTIVNEITAAFDNDNCFATLTSYLDVSLRSGATVLASADTTPLIAQRPHGDGTVFYYGVIDDASDFKTLPSYPIFWNNVITVISGAEDIADFNFKAGTIVTIDEQNVKTPSSSFSTSKVVLDEAGYYEFNGRRYAVNLLDEEESEVTGANVLESDSETSAVLASEARVKAFAITSWVMLAILLLVLFELFYIKRRGDL